MHPQNTTDPTTEEWRPVIGYEGWYSVSSLGRVRRDATGRLLRPTVPAKRYALVSLSRGPGTPQGTIGVHKLVADAFLGPRPPGCEVNHRNGHKDDNRTLNLEWATPKQNSEHAVRMGLTPSGDRSAARLHPESYRGDKNGAHRHPEKMARGSDNGWARLTEAEVAEILVSTDSQATLAARYGVTQTTIGKVLCRTYWRHVAAPDGLAQRNWQRERNALAQARRGERNPSAKLDEDAIREIRASSLTGAALAKKYGVGQSTISRIRRGTHWRHIGAAD